MNDFIATKLGNGPILTDGGLETTLIFQKGLDLPHFAAFDLLNRPNHRKILADYYREYLTLAARYHTGFILESPTWRASNDWAYQMGYSESDLVAINRFAIQELEKLKAEYASSVSPILISGCIGPRSDGYQIKKIMSAVEAEAYHGLQVKTFKDAGADMVDAMTLNYANEALGIVRSAKAHHIPVVISFTVETDGNLPSGQPLGEVVSDLDQQTDSYPAYYMINCAHPEHFADKLTGEKWSERIAAIRANASCKSHAELDESTELDPGNKEELADWYRKLGEILPNLQVYGGCCGTDVSHIEAVCEACEFNAIQQ